MIRSTEVAVVFFAMAITWVSGEISGSGQRRAHVFEIDFAQAQG
jgi:hypothetical protein